MTRIVLAAGMPRSGSTWLYNAARFLLEGKYSNVGSAWVHNHLPSEERDVEIIKIHEPDPAWLARADTVLASRRDLRDVVASAASMGWVRSEPEMLRWARESRRVHEYWSKVAAVEFAYEEIVRDPTTVMTRLARALDLDVQADEVSRCLARIPSKNSNGGPDHDPKTLLHPVHITDGRPGRWRGQLSHEVAEQIWKENEPWLTAQGYPRN